MNNNNKINYIEIPVKDISKTKTFFSEAFGWGFIDYGPEYCAFNNAGIDGGFYLSDNDGYRSESSPLVVLYSSNILAIKQKLEGMGAEICKDIFEFPGGCRFHFKDINNNEYAIWSEKA